MTAIWLKSWRNSQDGKSRSMEFLYQSKEKRLRLPSAKRPLLADGVQKDLVTRLSTKGADGEGTVSAVEA